MNPEDMPLASLSAVKAKDKQRWLDLFEDNATIEDPVGVSPTDPTGKGHIGKAAISAFYAPPPASTSPARPMAMPCSPMATACRSPTATATRPSFADALVMNCRQR